MASFYRTFNCNKEHTMRIWRFIKEKDNGITNFHFEIAGDILDEEEIEVLNSMRAGLVQLAYKHHRKNAEDTSLSL